MTASQHLALDLSHHPKLDRVQAGHLRHFHNLATQLDGEWRHMGALEPGQEFLDAYRYQLATMAYATGAAHYHRVPAMRSVFKPLLRALIHKMLRREAWGYWFNTSLGGNRTNPDQKEYRKPWSDPVVRENIMYSGHLLLMTSLYAMLFDDDEFEKPGSIAFHWDPLFFGFGSEVYEYDNRSLQKVILADMERNGWLGVCCEPNVVFVVCNQFPLVGMRYNDSRDGTDIVNETLEKYKAAWERKNMNGPNGLLYDWWFVQQDMLLPASDIGFGAWAGAFMNSWNPNAVREQYDTQALGFITKIEGKIRLNQPEVGNVFRKLVHEEKADPHKASTLSKATEIVNALPKNAFPYTKPIMGYVLMWLSELGKRAELDALLTEADEVMKPTWEDGGLFYPRNDQKTDENGRWCLMDPFTGNSAVGYARLNVEDGQKKMWEHPWTKQELASRPWVDGISLAQGVDCLRAVWDDKHQALIVTLRTWNGVEVAIAPVARNLPSGSWAAYINGELSSCSEAVGGSLEVPLTVTGKDTDVVIVKIDS